MSFRAPENSQCFQKGEKRESVLWMICLLANILEFCLVCSLEKRQCLHVVCRVMIMEHLDSRTQQSVSPGGWLYRRGTIITSVNSNDLDECSLYFSIKNMQIDFIHQNGFRRICAKGDHACMSLGSVWKLPQHQISFLALLATERR